MSTSKKHVRRYRGGDISVRKKKPSPLSSSSIEVPVNNVLTKVLVDTGASISLIHAEVLHRMTHEPLVSSSLTEVHTANCGFISLLGLVKLNIPIGQVNTTADVYVTRDLVCPMILGRDWIHKNQVTLCFSTNILSVHSGRSSTPLSPMSTHESFVMLASHSVVIPPFHEKFVSGCKRLGSQCCLFDKGERETGTQEEEERKRNDACVGLDKIQSHWSREYIYR